ncbi:MAG TPA: FAD-dependent oxidoreductase [Leptospiraceae bacterium]|nr:FAD-dependent oxidoreductase [Leptospiraceae bacterium]
MIPHILQFVFSKPFHNYSASFLFDACVNFSLKEIIQDRDFEIRNALSFMQTVLFCSNMTDFLIIGSGIIGCWTAMKAAEKGYSVAVCEKEKIPGDGISGRNSGVLHSGVYYKNNSLKHIHCMRGYALTLEFAEKYKIPYLISGKIITSGKKNEFSLEKEEEMEKLFENGKNNGVKNLCILKNPGEKYTGVLGKTALDIPCTGIVDVPAYLKTLIHLCEEKGVIFLKDRKFSHNDGISCLTDSRSAKEQVDSGIIINAAGLYSDMIAQEFGLSEYSIRPNKGEYFRFRKPLPYKKLIYPVPSKKSTALGVHYTFNMGDEAYAGPNSDWAENKEDYKITADRKIYYQSVCNILNCYSEEDLSPGYAGLRPRLFRNGEPLHDFVIIKHSKNVIHLLGIESPGLTSSPSIAEEVLNMI